MANNWAYALSQGAAAAAGSAVQSIDRQIKEDAEARAADRELDIKKRLEAARELMQQRAEERKLAANRKAGADIDAKATGMLASSDAAAIDASLGSTIDPTNPESAATLAAIRANPEAAKAYGLKDDAPIDKVRRRGEAARSLGHLDHAKEASAEERNLITDKRNQDLDKAAERRAEIQERQLERQNTLAAATLAYQRSREKANDARADAAAQRELRAATSKALDGANADVKALEKELANPLLDPAQAKVVQGQLNAARAEAGRYRQALAGAGLELPEVQEPPKPAPPPAAVEALRRDPKLKDQFDAKYGAGAAEKALGASAPAAPAATTPAAPAAPSGLLTTAAPPAYVPPPDSPAGKAAAGREAVRTGAAQAQQQQLADAQAKVHKALQSRDPLDAQAAQDAPGFAQLPQEMKAQIFSIVRGR